MYFELMNFIVNGIIRICYNLGVLLSFFIYVDSKRNYYVRYFFYVEYDFY